MTEVESKQALENASLSNYKIGLSNIIYQVFIAKDGKSWCALIGQDLQTGIAGFGCTVKEALKNLADKL